MISNKIKPIIEKLEYEFKKIQIKKKFNLITITPKLGLGYKKTNKQKSHNIHQYFHI